MEKIDLIFTVIFIIIVVIIMVLIYFYNIRHKFEDEDILDEFVVEDKLGEDKLYSSNDSFDWSVYESDLSYDYDTFLGYDLWKNKESAEKRIEKIKEEYRLTENSVSINMLESMMLVSKYGEDIVLDKDGIYQVRKINIVSFIDSLEYDLDTIRLITEIKDELSFSIENYEVDAKTIFYIMSNAKTLGLHNVINNSQIFLFAKKNNSNLTIDADIILEDGKGMSNIKLMAKEFFHETSDDDSDNDEETSSENNIFDYSHRRASQTEAYLDENNKRVIKYENGQKMIRNNLWEVEQIEDVEDDRGKTKDKSFSEIINAHDVNSIMEEANEENIKSTNHKNYSKESEPTKEVINDKEESSRNSIKNVYITGAKLYDLEDQKINFVGFLGKIKDEEDFINKISNLSEKNIRAVLILLLSIDSSIVNIEGDEINLIYLDGDDNYYISYEHMALVLTSLIENQKEFLISNLFIHANGSLSYPLHIIDSFIGYLKSMEMDLFSQVSKSIFVRNSDDILLSVKAIEIKKNGVELIGHYNGIEKISQIIVSQIKREDFKKLKTKKYSVNFRYFL